MLGETIKNTNEQYTEQSIRRKHILHKVGTFCGLVILIIVVAAIYPRWNQIWYDFGQNLYHAING